MGAAFLDLNAAMTLDKPTRMKRKPLRRGHLAAALTALFAAVANPALAADRYREVVQPFVEKYCVRCHGAMKPKGELDLSRYAEAQQVTADFRRWENVIE